MEVVIDGIIYQLQSKGGISRLFSELLPRVCDADDSVCITLSTQGPLSQGLPKHPHIFYQTIPSVERYLRPHRIWQPIVPKANQLLRQLYIGRGKRRIWHSTYYTLPEKWSGPLVVTVVDMIEERFPNVFKGPGYDQFRARKRLCVREADAIVCISETTYQDVRRLYGPECGPVYIVPLACNDVFRQLEKRFSSSKTVGEKSFLLYVGTRSYYKNFDRLIHAYSLWRYREEIELVVVGRPWSLEEEKRLVELGILERVCLLQGVDDETLSQLYNQAAAFVYPSLYEGFGIPLLEAMACGCPIIASHIPSTIEVAGLCPIYFEPTELDDLLRAFDAALAEGGDSKRTRVGLERIKEFSWDKTAVQTLQVYRGLLGIHS